MQKTFNSEFWKKVSYLLLSFLSFLIPCCSIYGDKQHCIMGQGAIEEIITKHKEKFNFKRYGFKIV